MGYRSSALEDRVREFLVEVPGTPGFTNTSAPIGASLWLFLRILSRRFLQHFCQESEHVWRRFPVCSYGVQVVIHFEVTLPALSELCLTGFCSAMVEASRSHIT